MLCLSADRFVSIASALRTEFGLSLFGFDVIIPNIGTGAQGSGSDDYVVIDVNFFPSYKEVEDFPSRLRKYLRRRVGLPALSPEEFKL